jgi:hypothetical protein
MSLAQIEGGDACKMSSDRGQVLIMRVTRYVPEPVTGVEERAEPLRVLAHTTQQEKAHLSILSRPAFGFKQSMTSLSHFSFHQGTSVKR